jgi:signal peptidase I
VRDGILYNDEPATRVRDNFRDDDGTSNGELTRYRETLPGGRSYTVLDIVAHGSLTTPTSTVPDGYVLPGGNAQFLTAAQRRFIPIENLTVGRDHLLRPMATPGCGRSGGRSRSASGGCSI